MSTGLVVVLAVAALAPLVAVRLRLPGALLEIVAGIVLGPAVLGLVRPDATLSAVALLGLSFLLFLAGSEVDLRRFRGTLGKRVAVSLAISLVAAACVVGVLLLAGLAAIGLAVAGVEHSMPLTALVGRLADTSAQIRVRWTVLLVAGLALAAHALGFEAILGAFLAGMLVRALDPDPERTHPLYPVKLDAVGYGLLVPVFFVTSGLALDLRGLAEHPVALATVPAFLLALLVVRGLPALAFRRELAGRELSALALLQATSLPFLIAATTIGREMGVLDPAVAAGLVAAGLASVLVFPAVAVALLPRIAEPVPS